MDDRVNITRICRMMHWTYDDYMDAPDWMLESLDIISDAESLHNSTLGDESNT